MLGIKAIIIIFLMEVDWLSTCIQGHSLGRGVRKIALFLAVPLFLGLRSDVIYFGALRIGVGGGARSRQISGSPDSWEFLETKRSR